LPLKPHANYKKKYSDITKKKKKNSLTKAWDIWPVGQFYYFTVRVIVKGSKNPFTPI